MEGDPSREVVSAVAARLRLKPWMPGRLREFELYAEACGVPALERQVQLGIENHRCCWLPKDGPHHVACSTGARSG